MKTLIATCLGAAVLISPAQADFVEVTPASLDVGGASAAWGDYDNDGDDDLFVGRHSLQGTDKLFRYDGGLTFVEVPAPPLTEAIYTYGAGWADYDNDRDLDLFVNNTDISPSGFFPLQNLLARNDGEAGFSDVTGGDLLLPTAGGFVWGDFDGDGDVDLYLTDSQALKADMMFRNDGNDVFTLVPAGDASGVR